MDLYELSKDLIRRFCVVAEEELDVTFLGVQTKTALALLGGGNAFVGDIAPRKTRSPVPKRPFDLGIIYKLSTQRTSKQSTMAPAVTINDFSL